MARFLIRIVKSLRVRHLIRAALSHGLRWMVIHSVVVFWIIVAMMFGSESTQDSAGGAFDFVAFWWGSYFRHLMAEEVFSL